MYCAFNAFNSEISAPMKHNYHITIICRFCCMAVVFTILAIALQSCISLKSEYPRTAYYRLEQKAVRSFGLQSPQSLLVKPFTIDSEFDTDRMITLVNGTEAQPLNYHRWTSEPQELITAHVRSRLAQSGAFTGGVFTPESSVITTLTLEGRIVECLARSLTANPANTATLTVHFTVQRLEANGAASLLLQKMYTQTLPRANDAAASIAPAMSDAASAVCDSLLSDLASALTPK
jgi:ABC-type uncharacterized transport system auxiliary subunit